MAKNFFEISKKKPRATRAFELGKEEEEEEDERERGKKATLEDTQRRMHLG